MSAHPLTIRVATEADQADITQLIHEAGLNPTGLHWRRFAVADEDGRMVGCAQLKIHRQGTPELASVAVVPDRRGDGIGSRLVETLIAGQSRGIYLTTVPDNVAYFERFAFHAIHPGQTPGDFRRAFYVSRIATSILSIYGRRRIRILPMRRDPL
jgi:N-acetylglutamate synthase-like GNAT family acetyltransferase